MAATEQMCLIGQGVASFNKWREENPEIVIDLRDEDMHGMNLKNINLSHAILDGVDLSYALPGNANLSFVKLGKANLSHAETDNVDLSHGDLRRGRFALAHFRNGILFYTRLRGADLRHASL